MYYYFYLIKYWNYFTYNITKQFSWKIIFLTIKSIQIKTKLCNTNTTRIDPIKHTIKSDLQSKHPKAAQSNFYLCHLQHSVNRVHGGSFPLQTTSSPSVGVSCTQAGCHCLPDASLSLSTPWSLPEEYQKANTYWLQGR